MRIVKGRENKSGSDSLRTSFDQTSRSGICGSLMRIHTR